MVGAIRSIICAKAAFSFSTKISLRFVSCNREQYREKQSTSLGTREKYILEGTEIRSENRLVNQTKVN